MLSKNKAKFITNLEQKKQRKAHNCFIVEGEKMVNELLNSSMDIIELFHTSEYNIDTNVKIPKTLIENAELKKISQLKTPNKVLAIVQIPKKNNCWEFNTNLNLVLDNIQDPGNLGTIIRTAAWFGIKTIYCSENTVDAFNNKVVQSTMGAIFHTQIIYTNLNKLLNTAKEKNITIYGTLLSGSNIYKLPLKKQALLVLGNESKGISNEIEVLIDNKIKIPSFPDDNNIVESLNVGIAASIVCSEFRRQHST